MMTFADYGIEIPHAAPGPEVAMQTAALPVARPSEEVRLFLMGRDLGDQPLNMEAELLNAAGARVGEIELTQAVRVSTGMPGYDGIKTGFRTDDLESGAYALALTISGFSDGSQETMELPFRVAKE